ncbi:alpha/beta hydrolase family protein [Neolewinella sp.]|uniref:alpha/beta hydrolase family protein n=1 Tax=Neolewinella sp. TaxID=2993543 RepID=UPI003B51F6A1
MSSSPYRSLTILLFLLSGLLAAQSTFDADPARRDTLRNLLGAFPTGVPLDLDTLETVDLEGGVRLKIAYTVELPDPVFDTPIDRISAYLFVPDRQGEERLPAIVAIHQDGPQAHLGKEEPAGLAGADDMHYALELFQRGYVVICPDRYYHAGRRRIVGADTAGTDWDREDGMISHWTGQLLMRGRTPTGKEAYDLVRTTDVLVDVDGVDTSRIGTIGHSAGGYVMVYFMFVDPRIKAGVSSCGFHEVMGFYMSLPARYS